ncbi:MAG: DUF3536 domain-containing protein [Sphaerochaetaceae bacterium]|nr:DUF3536 domain-containing protein [Sphaerochaetaceae bacterium]MDC7237053.1 DUF3536 domain-containing protein [Sphaerochaetaceae bacterium]
MSNTNKKKLILHGHFYQPPRENPFTGIIPKQHSASPFINWNERILHECYESNTRSRYLDSKGKIVSLLNNFEYISFNFGPTLLSWIESHHKDVHDKIIEADKKSIERLGHGNAIAQGFNHSILPLDSQDDARLQIHWGIEDFKSRFDRMPEGMWLPETAVNESVIDILVEEGIKFIILSPWQCQAIEDENQKIVQLKDQPAPYDTPFYIYGENGNKISAFFYNPQLAEGISFGHLLQDADNLYSVIKGISEKDNTKLIHTATDGEIYGHHEPFGDMALAALIKKVYQRDEFELTNYATFLEKNPPKRRAYLKPGEDNKGTSWSCFHGVSRWYKDCGCHTGGEPSWNQKWRLPLRIAFVNNANRLKEIYNTRILEIFNSKVDPYQLLLDYSKAVCGSLDMVNFIDNIVSSHSEAKGYETEIASLLVGIKNTHFSFTSCGWFFNDLAGVEPVQNINYALYSINLFQKYSKKSLLTPFLKDLKVAKCNNKSDGDGMSLAQKSLNLLPGEVEASLYFILNRLIAKIELFDSKYGRFNLTKYMIVEENIKFEIYDSVSLRKFKGDAVLDEHSGETGFELYLTLTDKNSKTSNHYTINNNDVNERIVDLTYKWIERSLSVVDDLELKQIARDIDNYSMISKGTKYIPTDTIFIENIGTCLRALRSLFITPNTLTWESKKQSISHLIDFIMIQGSKKVKDTVKSIFNEEAKSIAMRIQEEGLHNNLIEYTINFLSMAHEEKLNLEMKALQNIIYTYMNKDFEALNIDKDLFNDMKILLNFA